MKHLKKFENLDLIKEWDLLLSEEEFQKWADEFDTIIESFLYYETGFKLRFETAYGQRVIMSLDDYLQKNDTYKEFIHGLPARGLKFKSTIIISGDYDNLIKVLDDIKTTINRISDIGWESTSLEVGTMNDGSFRITNEFKKV
jgi:hypothetical protein